MIRHSFNSNWTVAPKRTPFDSFTGPAGAAPVVPRKVTLPHDALRDAVRSPDSPNGSHTAYFPSGYFRYEKTFDVPDHYREKVVVLEFEGIYRDAMVYINGDLVANRPSGYAGFTINIDAYLRYGQPNQVAVECRTHQDSRWYTGAGIYRDTYLAVGEPVHIPLDGLRVSTEYVEDAMALVAAEVIVANATRATRTVRVTTTVTAHDGSVVATGSAPITLLPNTTGTARFRLAVENPSLWSPDAPNLHQLEATVAEGDESLDEAQTAFGIRILRLDTNSGLRINGHSIKLRGACIHHDNGPLGSAIIARAERRRIEILKDAGFNAIRSSHNPISRTMLDACDELGILVMDELTDIWTEAKTGFDYSISFPEWWERDLEAMVTKDFNHPSVIFYSIGNEIFETGSPIGSTWGRRLVDKLSTIDSTRYVTNSINPTVSLFDFIAAMMAQAGQQQDVNSAMGAMGDGLAQLVVSDLVTDAIEESAAQVDLLGLNYADARYELDAQLFPNRLLVGSETNPAHIDELWGLVSANTHVIGDFTWTGWDYLGESGLGRVDYTDEPGYHDNGLSGTYPYLTATAGDIDITGHRRTVSHYREIVLGRRNSPYIAVHRPENHGRPTKTSGWSWTDSIASWSWDVTEGSPVTVDVYTNADEVELFVAGSSVARKQVGVDKGFLARFETTYRPGDLTAVAYTNGNEQGRWSLTTATDDLRLDVRIDRPQITADEHDLAYVNISLRDVDGVLATHRDRSVAVTITGPGTLAGLASGRPSSKERFDSDQITTWDGLALAIIRPTGRGNITITVTADGCDAETKTITAD